MRGVRTTVAALAVLAVIAAACGGDDTVDESTDDATDESTDDATDEAIVDGDETDDPADAGEGDDADPGDDAGEGDDGQEDADGDANGDEPEPEAAPTPVEDRMDDPCAMHGESSENVFIDVVSPVDGQEVDDDEVALVGCANVHEGTVSWRLLDTDGEVLDDGFTTADCAITCNGTFDDTVPLGEASGHDSVVLEVFSENVDDEGPPEFELRSFTLVLG